MATKKQSKTKTKKQIDLENRIKKYLDFLSDNGYKLMDKNRHFCTSCETYKDRVHFYKNNSRLYKSKILPVCKTCIDKFYAEYLKENNKNEKISLYELCKELNIVWKESIWEAALKSETSTKGRYFIISSSLPQYSGMTFKDSDSYDNEKNVPVIDKENNVMLLDKLEKLKYKYGDGFTNEEYENFEKKYNKLKIGYKEKTSLHTERLIDYIIKKVKEEMALAQGKVSEAAKYQTMVKEAAAAAKLNVSQLSKSDVTGGIDLVPQLVEAVEDYVSLIPVMPKLKEVPYDDADIIIWAINNKIREIDNLPKAEYKDIYNFYEDSLISYYEEQGLDKNKIQEEIKKRKTVFRDLGEVYYEPTYESGDD